ncbi:MAG: nickel pincer cofactor biosynthesis protein LarC [Eubacteriaceae bacterium]|nr:nickel pincer cofactor biosynthesis protein LarC [Eubacteriaceae bacterium]
MKGIYFDCSMGAAGDMLSGAVYSLLSEGQQEEFLRTLNGLGIGTSVYITSERKQGILGVRFHCEIGGKSEGEEASSPNSHSHSRHAAEIDRIIESFDISETVKANALKAFKLLYEAESHVHGQDIGNIHLHEVGSLDAIVDICAFCLGIDMLGVGKILSSPINTGQGHVKTAHGILPVPAPATAYILRGAKIYSDGIESELCTPTGASLLKAFAASYGPMPVLSPIAIGYGFGSKDFERVNAVRAILFEEAGAKGSSDGQVAEISANIDDMTPEDLAFACEAILAEGALDCFVAPIAMKKSRLAFLLTCIAKPEDAHRLAQFILKHTTTIGLRFAIKDRITLDRAEEELSTEYGTVRVKVSQGFGIARKKLEFDDLRKIAIEKGFTIAQARSLIGESQL